MKLNLGKRIVFFLHWLLSLGLLVYTALAVFGVIPSDIFSRYLGIAFAPIAFIVFILVYLLLSLFTVSFLLKRGSKRSERGFIVVDSSETGKVRIAVSAIEQMIKQAVCNVDGIADMKIFISGEDDVLSIKVNVVMVNGSHVPTVTMNMQRSIRQFIEMNCGVAVHSVSINIQSVVNVDEAGRKTRKQEQKTFVAAQPPVPVVPAAEESVPEFEPIQDPAVEEAVSEPEVQEMAEAEEDLKELEMTETVIVEELVCGDAECIEMEENAAVEEENVEMVSAEEEDSAEKTEADA